MSDYRQGRHEDDVRLGDRPVSSDSASSESRAARLAQTIEGEIIPRLMLVHRAAAANRCSVTEKADGPSAADVVELARLVLAGESSEALAFVDRMLASGTSLETVYLELFAPVARHLGMLWDTDEKDFIQVTMGLSRLQELVHELSPAYPTIDDPTGAPRRILLVSLPGEQHTFGSSIVAEFFRRAGWDVCADRCASKEDIIEKVSGESFSIVGVSLASERLLDQLAGVIRSVRRASMNRSIGVMVGGLPFLGHPERVSLVGADATASDGRQAIAQANSLAALLANRVS